LISIVIPTWNQNEMTVECITAIRENTQDCEIIVVDNGSNPPFEKPYTGFIDTTVIRNDKNMGFPIAINQGVRAAKRDVVILLNNDVVVTPGWADKLMEALHEFSIVGPTTNICSGIQRNAVGSYNNKDELNAAAEEWAENFGGHILEVRWIIGFCMAIRRSVFDDIGYMDEAMWPCCGEEVDFCLRAREAGHRIGVVFGCYVHHEGSVTFKSMDDEHPYREIVERNNRYLEKKWGKNVSTQELCASTDPVGVSINLGCGPRKLDGFINLDYRPEANPDQVCDVREGLPFDTNTVDLVRADDFLEHIPIGEVIPLMNEIWRVLKPGGTFESSTPSTDGRGAFQDPTHVSFWNINSWHYYSDPENRDLCGILADFEIESIEDRETDPMNNIIHTHVIAKARK